MKTHRILLVLWLPLVLLAMACNMEKEVEIELPDYERQLVVECYLEVGKPMRILLTESVGFTEGPDTPIVTGALVVIGHDNVWDTLSEGLYLDFETLKFFNYGSSTIVPRDYSTTYTLRVEHPDGRIVTGTTRVMPRVDMGELVASYNADSNAALTMRWPDQGGQENFYRVSLHKKALIEDEETGAELYMDFTLDDRIGDGEMFTIATLFDFQSGDTLISTLYHIDEGYWRYIASVDDAVSSNGNPFGQPGIIRSTVSGGLGVFTGFDLDRDTLIVP